VADIKIIREEWHSYNLLFDYEMLYGNMSWKNVQYDNIINNVKQQADSHVKFFIHFWFEATHMKFGSEIDHKHTH